VQVLFWNRHILVLLYNLPQCDATAVCGFGTQLPI
jgi:hypothetical protein